MASRKTGRTKGALGEKSQIYADLFVVDNKRKDQTNDGELIF